MIKGVELIGEGCWESPFSPARSLHYRNPTISSAHLTVSIATVRDVLRRYPCHPSSLSTSSLPHRRCSRRRRPCHHFVTCLTGPPSLSDTTIALHGRSAVFLWPGVGGGALRRGGLSVSPTQVCPRGHAIIESRRASLTLVVAVAVTVAVPRRRLLSRV